MAVRLRWAFFTAGSRKAFTPLLTASTPVRAVQPLAKTLSNSQKLTATVPRLAEAEGEPLASKMTSAEQHPQNARDDRDENRSHKEISRNGENCACFANAAQIEDGDDDQDAHAQWNHVRQQRRNGRDQRAYSRRNAHGGGENVVGQQRCRGQQSRR